MLHIAVRAAMTAHMRQQRCQQQLKLEEQGLFSVQCTPVADPIDMCTL